MAAAAAAGARFSIREYAAQARAGGGSWPFGGDAGALPPMEVRRFRWWADEAAAVEEEEREVERRMAAKRRKRSVAELFAAVPRVRGGQGKRAVNGMHAKEKVKLVLAVEVKASKGFKKKKKASMGTVVRNKEKSGSIKATSTSTSQLFQDSTRKKKLTKSPNSKKRDQEVSVSLDKKSSKGKKNSLLDSKRNASENSVQAQSILEKQSKVRFSTLMDTTDDKCKLNSSCKPKHVSFSHDIFGWTVPLPGNNTEKPQSVQTPQQPSQEVHDQRVGEEPQLVYQQSDAIPGTVEEDTSSISELVVSTGVCCTFPVTKPMERTIVGSSVGTDNSTEISNSRNYINSINLARLSSNKMPSQYFDGVDSHLDNGEDFSLGVNPANLTVKAISGDIYRSLSSQPSSPCLNDRSAGTLPERLVANCHLGKDRHKFVRSGKDAMSSISSSAGSKKSSDARADCVPASRNMNFIDDYVGLPLNSRGEFVKLHPGETPNSVSILKRQSLGESSSCPSAFPAFTTSTFTDHVNVRPNHHVPQIYTVDQSPQFTATAPTECEMDFRQLPCSERMKTHKYAVMSNKRPCYNQHELSAGCFYSECIECHNPQQKLLGMQTCFMRQDYEHNTQPTAEATMRLMGKTVTLGTSRIQCRDLNNKIPGSSKQARPGDRSFQGTCRKAFPQLFPWEKVVDSPSAFRISHGEREVAKNPAFLSFVPAAELRSEIGTNNFRTNSHSRQPELAVANKLNVQPAAWCNEGGLQHQQPVMPNQLQSNAEDMLLGSMHRTQTQNEASMPYVNRRNSIRNLMEKRPASYQLGYFKHQLSNMTQRNPMSSSQSDYAAVQRPPGLTTQTKFTSLPPLPPSLTSSHVYNPDYAQPRGSSTNHPSIPATYPTSKSNARGNAISGDERFKWAMMGSNVEGLEHMNGNGKRPADKDDVFLTLPKKPCTTAPKDLNLLPIPGRGPQFCGYRPDARPVDIPVGFGPESQPELRLGSQYAHTTLSYPAKLVRPVKLKSGVRHILQPSASSMSQDVPWTVLSVVPMENAACTASTSKSQDTDFYKL